MRRRKNSHQPNLRNVKVMVMGQDGVGKTESTYRHQLQIDNEFIYIDLMDTAGENNSAKLERCVNGGDLFLLLYSIEDHASFDEATRIGRYFKHQKFVENRLILIGNKKDLEHLRQVDETEGSDLAQELDCPFYEISVSECDGYKDVSDMVYRCLKKYLQCNTENNDKNNEKVEQPRPHRTPNMLATTSSLIKMKEGWMKKAGRRKSVSTL